jgi:DNA repair protein SbcD/Mre11
MKFLHTSDWHIGRTVRGESRLPEHEGALQEILSDAIAHKVDAVLMAGDIFDSSAPSPESEALVYNFFRELHGAAIPAFVIAGNHDHPKRWDAVSPLLKTAGINALGRPDHGKALMELESRDGKETAQIIGVPWIGERDSVDFETLQGDTADPLREYAARVGQYLEVLTNKFDPSKVNVLMSHVFVDGAKVGIGGGERELHIATNIYGVPVTSLPTRAQYIAMGHVHRPQNIECGTSAWYSGSLLQMDFGERDQNKYVNIVEIHAKQPARVIQEPIKSGRAMVDIGSPEKGVPLNDLARFADANDKSWFRVYVDADAVPNLPQLVRGTLSSAVTVTRTGAQTDVPGPNAEERQHLGPIELFSLYYASRNGEAKEPDAHVIEVFRGLLTAAQSDMDDDP